MKKLLVICILAVAVCIFFWEVLFGGRVLLDANPYHLDPWRLHATDEDLTGRTHRTDSFLTYLPRWVELSRGLRSGRLPLWNPYVFAGAPFYADPQSRAAYPVALGLALVDPLTAMGLDLAIHFFIALAGMYLFLRAIGATPIGSMIGAFSYAFSSFFYVRMGHPTFVASAAWIPFFFYGFELAGKSARKGTALLAVFLAMGYLAGFPQVFAFGVAGLVGYAIYLSIDRNPQNRLWTLRRSARILLISGVLSMLLVSIQLVPFLEMLKNSTGLGIGFDEMRDVYLAPPVLLLRSFFPSFFGNPAEGTDWSDLTRHVLNAYKPDFAVYCGLGTLMLALGALVFVRKSPKTRVFFLMLTLSVGIATSPLLLKLAYSLLPIVKLSKVSRISVLACFAVSALSGLSYSMMSKCPDRRTRKAFLVIAGAVLAALLAVSLVFTLVGDSAIDRLSERVRSVPEETWQKAHPLTTSEMIEQWSERGDLRWSAYERAQIRRGMWFGTLAFVLIFLWLRQAERSQIRRTVFAVLLLAFVAVEVVFTARTYLVSQPAVDSLETEGIRFLARQLGKRGRWRTLSLPAEAGVRPVLQPNTNQLFRIPSLGGTATGVPEAYTKRFREDQLMRVRPHALKQAVPMRLADILANDLMSVRYITTSMTSQPGDLSSPLFESLASTQEASDKLRILPLIDGSRLAFCQKAGESISFDVDLPVARSLDFAVGFDRNTRIHGDSLKFSVTCESKLGKVHSSNVYDLGIDAGKWHPLRLDVSSLGGCPCSVTLSVSSERTHEQPTVTAGWSWFEFVVRDCPMEKIRHGYRIKVGECPQVLSFWVTSKAREIPVEILHGGTERSVRWVAFPSNMPFRRMLVDLSYMSGGAVRVVSDSSFTLEAPRIVHTGNAYLNHHLVYDGDMQVYENFAAVEKGVCIDKGRTKRRTVDRDSELELTLGDIDKLRCGKCEIVSYKPEEVVLRISAWRDCFLIFQDIHYPGWRAYVDGKGSEILRTSLGIRAVELTKGEHEVVMAFKPRSLTLGLALTVMGITLAVLYSALGTRRKSA
jgi:hypothetical protein